MHRTQITLTDTLVSKADRLRLLDTAFGAWGHRKEGGAEFVERVRSGTARRLRSTG